MEYTLASPTFWRRLMNKPLSYLRTATLLLVAAYGLLFNPVVMAKEKELPAYLSLKDGRHQITLPDSAVYDGTIRNGRLEGKGILQWRNGAKYIGEFKNGLKHGAGEFISAHGDKYIGTYKHGLEEGRGTYLFNHGDKYHGEVKNGDLEGQGKYYFSNGDVYSGNFKKGNAEGQGEYLYANGTKYKGQIKAWRLHGKGIFEYGNGDKYDGEFQEGVFHGKAILYLSNSEGGKNQIEGVWKEGQYQYPDIENDAQRLPEKDAPDAEAMFLDQDRLFSNSVKDLKISRPNMTDLYFVAFGSYSDQDVFMKEALYSKEQIEKIFGSENRTLALVNNYKSLSDRPLATVRNLKRAVMSMAALMDKEQDVLFLYITSHGSKNHKISVNMGDIPLRDLTPDMLFDILKDAGIKWKVVAISACYSGGFVDKIKNDHTLVITAASATKTSFGCSDDADLTYFGKAFFQEALPMSASFSEAFVKAKALVKKWEDAENYDHSDPQIARSPLIERKLTELQRTLPSRVGDRFKRSARPVQ